jgi:hypothetical protein
MIQGGLLFNNQYWNWQGSFTGGVHKRNWVIGAGCAIDNYKARSIPVFVDIRRNITTKNIPLFVCLDGGINLPFIPAGTILGTPPVIVYLAPEYRSGFYSDISLGWLLKVAARKQLALSLGYSMKTITELDKVSYQGNNSMKRDFLFNRVLLKIGVLLK